MNPSTKEIHERAKDVGEVLVPTGNRPHTDSPEEDKSSPSETPAHTTSKNQRVQPAVQLKVGERPTVSTPAAGDPKAKAWDRDIRTGIPHVALAPGLDRFPGPPTPVIDR